MSIIKTEKLCKDFGELKVLKDCSLEVEQGEVVCIIGPSGAGKSTFLRSLNRLEKITSGKIWINDILIDDRKHGTNRVKMEKKEKRIENKKVKLAFKEEKKHQQRQIAEANKVIRCGLSVKDI